MTAAEVMDVIARLPDCDGQVAHALTAYTQVKMENAPTLPREVVTVLVRHQRSRSSSGTTLVRTPTCRPLVGKTVRGRAVTKWTGACGRRLARLISYTHHTSDHRQYCHVGNTAQHCRLCLLQDSDCAWDLEDSKINFGRNLMYLWKSNICSFKLDVSEANVSIPQFYRVRNHFVEWWTANGWITCSGYMDVVMEVLRSSNSTKRPSRLAQ